MIKRYFLALLLAFCVPAFAQFAPNTVLTAAALNSAFATKTTNTNAAITGGTISGVGYVYINDTLNSQNALQITNTGGNGANIKLIGSGASTPNKYIRANGGNFQIINSTYANSILTLGDNGAMTIPGSFTAASATLGGILGSGSINLSYSNPILTLNDTSGTNASSLLFQNSGVSYWQLLRSSSGNLNFQRYVSGAFVDNPISIANATGIATFSNVINAPGIALNEPSNNTNTLQISNTGANGANIKLLGNGATTPNKTIRVQSGIFQILNNAYAAPVFSVDDNGNGTVGASMTATAMVAASPSATIVVNDTTSVGKAQINLRSNNASVWGIGNASSLGAFALDRYVSGTYVDSPITVANATGIVALSAAYSHAGQEIDRSYVLSTPAAGATVTLASGKGAVIITPAGTLATLTISLPACTAAYDGSIAKWAITQAVTTLTVSTAGGTVANAPTSAAAGTGNEFMCVGSNTTWYRMQ